jgi:hypothetical protein
MLKYAKGDVPGALHDFNLSLKIRQRLKTKG